MSATPTPTTTDDAASAGADAVADTVANAVTHPPSAPLDPASPRAAVVTHTLALGGAPKSLLLVAAALRARGFVPVLYHGNVGPLEKAFSAASIPCRYFPKSKGLMGLHLGFVYRILSQYRRDGVQLVFLNCLVPYYKYHALAARLLGLPVVWSIREDVRSKRARRLFRWLKRLATVVMPCSGEIATELRRQGVSVPVRVVHNGIAITGQEFEPSMGLRRELGIPASHWVVGCVGSIERRKGQVDLATAAGMWPREEGPLDVVVIGAPGAKGAADPYLQELQGAAAHLPAHVKLHLCGARREVAALYGEMDAVCLPTYWEGSSRTILEAMRARRPLLTTTAGGNPEIVRHLESAYLVSPGDGEAIARGLRYLKNHSAQAAAFAEAAHADLTRSHTLAHYTERVGGVIEEVNKCL